MRPAALLFDLDGTMLESDPIHMQVFSDMMAAHGHIVDEAFYLEHIHGRLNRDIFIEFLPHEPDPDALSEQKEAEFRRRLPRPYPATHGLFDVLDRAMAQGVKLAVVTNAMRLNAEAMLSAIDARSYFETIVIGEECARGKPHPDPYLSAMDQLGVAAADCIVFEDSPSGVKSAVGAGAVTIGLRSSLDDATLRRHGAHATIKNFTDPALDAVMTL